MYPVEKSESKTEKQLTLNLGKNGKSLDSLSYPFRSVGFLEFLLQIERERDMLQSINK